LEQEIIQNSTKEDFTMEDSLEMDKISLVSAEEQEAEQSDLIDFVWEHNRPHPMCIPHVSLT